MSVLLLLSKWLSKLASGGPSRAGRILISGTISPRTADVNASSAQMAVLAAAGRIST